MNINSNAIASDQDIFLQFQVFPFQDLVKDWSGCRELCSSPPLISIAFFWTDALDSNWTVCLSSILSFVLPKLACGCWKSLFGAAWSVFAFLSCSKTSPAWFLFSCLKPSYLFTMAYLTLFRLEKAKSKLVFLRIALFPLNLGGTHVSVLRCLLPLK